MISSLLTVGLTILKFVAIGTAAVFGVLALTVEYRDKKGKMTKWGRVALLGVVISAVISASIQTLETINANLDSREAARRAADQLRRSELVLTKIERIAHPMEPPEVTVVWQLGNSFPGGDALIKRLREFGKKLQGDPAIADMPNSGIFVSSSQQDGVPLSFRILPSSQLYPSREAEPELNTLIGDSNPTFSLFSAETGLQLARKKIEASELRPSIGYFGEYGDYSFSISSEDGVELIYHIERDVLSIWFTGTPEKRFIKQTGQIVSIPDLETSSGLLYASDVTVPSHGNDWPNLRLARQQLEPSIIFVNVQGRRYTFRRQEMKAFKNKAGYQVFKFGPFKSGKSQD